jgi:hypothetical protein
MEYTEVKELINAIHCIGDVNDIDVMGHDDITGMTPNSNLGSIASSLCKISETLEKIADIMVVNTKLD